MKQKSKSRRWHFWACFMGKKNGSEYAAREIEELKKKGFKAKIWQPLPQHQTSGHFHVVVLSTYDELFKLAGIERGVKET